MPERTGPRCAICGKRTANNWSMCRKHSLEFASYKKAPAWVKFLISDERKRRWREAHRDGYKREYSESSLETILDTARERSGDGGADSFWYRYGAFEDDMTHRRMECDDFAIEVLRRLSCEELNFVLMRNALEFSLPMIAKVVGIGYTTAWTRWAIVKRRLSELEAELAASEPGP